MSARRRGRYIPRTAKAVVPTPPPAPPQPAKPATAEQPVHPRFRALVADDDPATRFILGSILRESCRMIDVVARYGGEEFVLLLIETPAQKAAGFCEKIRAAVEQHQWSVDSHRQRELELRDHPFR